MNGKIFLIVGPSGVGKGTAIAGLKKRHPGFVYPISATTRRKRPQEQNGDVYYFLTKQEFLEKITQDEFLEWAIVHEDNYYGTLKAEIINGLKSGNAVIRELDIQGFESVIKKLPPSNVISIFITTKNPKQLKSRILKRAKISDAELEKRMRSAKKELAKKEECDYVVVSEEGKIEELINDVEKIIIKEMGT
jgi:guanylate kinase